MEEKRKRFLDKILNWFVDDTVIDRENRTWFPTFLDNLDLFDYYLNPIDISKLSLYPITRFYDYCGETYDLSGEEIEYLWGKYTIIIIDKFNNEKPLNESDDKRKRFLDKILNWLVDETGIDYEDRTWLPTFINTGITFNSSPLFPLTPLEISNLFINPLTLFYDYCEDTYGLDHEEIVYVWGKYRVIILKKINGGKPLNESEDKLEKYFNYVTDDLVKRTKHWRHPGNPLHVGVMFPFYYDELEFYYDEYELEEWLHRGWLVGTDDIKYLMSNYGLTEDECERVMEVYGIKVATLLLSKYGKQ